MDILFIPGGDAIIFTNTATGAMVRMDPAVFGAGCCERENLRDLDGDFMPVKPSIEFMHYCGVL